MSFAGGKLIWMNGQIVPWEQATVHVMAHALHYGSSVFEGIRVYKTPDGPQVFRLTDHMQRLFDYVAETGALPILGTIEAPPGIDWLCVSPKGSAAVVQLKGDELKLVYPQVEREAQPTNFESLDFRQFYLQPLHDGNIEKHTRLALDYCLQHPMWQLSLQTHKILGID